MLGLEQGVDKNSKLFTLNQSQQNYIYNAGVRKFLLEDYAEAQKIFKLLCIINSENSLYAKSYAGSMHAQKDYQQAITCYTTIYQYLPAENLDCLYYASVALFESRQFKLAHESFTQFMSLATTTNYNNMATKALSYLKMIKTVLSKNKE